MPSKRHEDINPSVISRSVLEEMSRTGKKARLVVAAVLAATASLEPSPQKAKTGKQRSAPTPVEVDDSRVDLLYIFYAAQITTLTYIGQGFNVKIYALRSSKDREAIE